VLEIYKFECFTSPCEIQLYGDDKTISDNCAKDILHEAKRLEKKYNYFDSNSLLSDINNRKINTLDTETKSLITRAKQYYKKTNKVFDITLVTIKHDKKLFDFVGCEHFEIKRNKIYFDNDFTKIDLGGFVKEHSVDRAVTIANKYKIKSALINFGGDIYAIGYKPDGTKYSIGITNPKHQNKILFRIDIKDEALTTSALYERAGHIISKNIMQKKILSSTVVSNNCVQSGVYSTSLMCDDTIDTKNKKYLINESLEILR